MNPHLAASLAVLEELFENVLELVRPLDPDCLNWTPPIPETNSIAALVTHTMGSIDYWLARAVGETAQRDRDAEFRARHTADELVDLVEHARSEARRRFALLDGADLGRVKAIRRLSINQEIDVTAGWCLEHAVIHAGEHWGQIQLNRQLYEGRR
jgi:uncharacterized damage-inducible protein DinB